MVSLTMLRDRDPQNGWFLSSSHFKVEDVLGCPRKLGSLVSKWVITYINGMYEGYNPFTNFPGHPSTRLHEMFYDVKP